MRIITYKPKKTRDIKELVNRAYSLYPGKIAFKELSDEKQVHEYSYTRLYEDINAFGTKLISMDMKGKHIAIIGENSYAWVLSYLTVINGVGVAVPLDKELTDADIVSLLKRGDADAVICSETFVDTIRDNLDACPRIKLCIVMNGKANEPFLSQDDLINDGYRLVGEGNKKYINAVVNPDEMCEIVFTSGTTGANKGVMLSHKNLAAVVYGGMSYIKPGEVSFSVLPISHTYECSCHILGGIYCGITICFNDSLKRVAENLKLFRPYFSVMVPLFLESMHREIWRRAKEDNLDRHLRFGIRFSNMLRSIGIDMRRKIFEPVIEGFGGNLCLVVSGGAPLRPEIEKGMTDLGIDVLNGYGITECGPLVSANSLFAKKKGSVGRIIPGCRVRIDSPNKDGIGEVLVKGDNVMLGYYNDPQSTKAVLTEDGWFRTGDLGRLSRRNYLYINGRKKNLIVLSNGKNVHPEEVEEKILTLPYVKEVMVYAPPQGGLQGSITACIYLDEGYFPGGEDIKARAKSDIRQMNRNLAAYKRITDIVFRDTEFDKTSTRKIKRNQILERNPANA